MVIGAGSRPHACRSVPSSRARIGPPNASWSGYAAAPARSASSQPGQTATSSSRKHRRSAPRRVDRGVAGDVEAARRAQREVAGAVVGGEPRRPRVRGAVLDHDDLRAAGGGLAGDRGERGGEVVAAVAGGEEDRGDGLHGADELRLRGVILLLHNRYRVAGGEERAVADLAWLIRSELGEEAEVLERDSAALGRGRAALGLLAGGPGARRGRPPRCGGPARASSTRTTCSRRSAGARWPPRARPAPGSCCTCTTTGSSARSGRASPAAPTARAATGATRAPACG